MAEEGDGTSKAVRAYFSDFIIDFLASLIPGVLFSAGFWLSFMIPISVSLNLLNNCPSTGDILCQLPGVEGSITAVGTTIATILFLTISFIIGTIVSRLTPKTVDYQSVGRLSQSDRDAGPSRQKSLDKNKVEFPYLDLKSYLDERGLSYLSSKIEWTWETPNRRTKHFINALKVRILASSPSSYLMLSRNEAHVRLSCSTWYVCRSIQYLSIVGSLIILLALLLLYNRGAKDYEILHAALLLFIPVATGLGFWIAKYFIETSFHYQRTREILHILELAHWLELTGVAPQIFFGLIEPPNPAGPDDRTGAAEGHVPAPATS
jgi:hypothetical protein